MDAKPSGLFSRNVVASGCESHYKLIPGFKNVRVLVATTCKPEDRKTPCVIRSLASLGASVTVGGDRFLGEVFYSRFLDGRIRYPHPNEHIKGFIESLVHFAAAGNFDVLLPMCDYTTLAVAANRDRLSKHTGLILPDYGALLKTRYKPDTIEIAQGLGIETPETFLVTSENDLKDIAGRIRYPCVIKPRMGGGRYRPDVSAFGTRVDKILQSCTFKIGYGLCS